MKTQLQKIYGNIFLSSLLLMTAAYVSAGESNPNYKAIAEKVAQKYTQKAVKYLIAGEVARYLIPSIKLDWIAGNRESHYNAMKEKILKFEAQKADYADNFTNLGNDARLEQLQALQSNLTELATANASWDADGTPSRIKKILRSDRGVALLRAGFATLPTVATECTTVLMPIQVSKIFKSKSFPARCGANIAEWGLNITANLLSDYSTFAKPAEEIKDKLDALKDELKVYKLRIDQNTKPAQQPQAAAQTQPQVTK